MTTVTDTKLSHSILEKTLGLKFKDPNFLQTALTHRSFLNESPDVNFSNERLEFLGDSVLSLLTSTELYNRFPSFPEGKLTNLRSSLVRTKTLADIAAKLNLGQYLRMSKGEEKSGGRQNISILADTFEAILGAIYLDQGLTSIKTLLAKHLFPKITVIESDTSIFDFKSRLQEVVQEKIKASPTYKVMSESGPDHDKIFTISVYLENKIAGTGTGKSKQEAEQTAAKDALTALQVKDK